MRPYKLNPGKQMKKLVVNPSDLRRFANKIRKSKTHWVWTAATDGNGYGRFWFHSHARWAHRFSYALFKGGIPDRMEVHHQCTVRSCVNPKHLAIRNHKNNSKHGRQRQLGKTAENTDTIPF
jgi:hypothetical protein